MSIATRAGAAHLHRGYLRGQASILILSILALAGIALVAWWLREPGVAAAPGDLANGSATPYAYAASGSDRLFDPGQASGATPVANRAGPARTPIAISRRAAEQAARTGTLQVVLPEGLAFPVHFERGEPSGRGNWTFIGRVDSRLGRLAAVITFGRAGAFGVLPTPDGRMLQLTTEHGQTYLQEAGGMLPPNARPAADTIVPSVPQGRVAPPPVTAVERSNAAERMLQATTQAAPSVPMSAAASTGTVDIRVLGVYTTNLVALRGSTAAVETEFTNLVAVANQAHADSGSVARFTLAGFRQADVPADTTNHQALSSVASNSLPDGLDVWQARDALEADLVAMLRPYADGDSTCGVAYLNGGGLNAAFLRTNYHLQSDYGYSVSNVDPCGPLVLAHELGHNLGSAHDRLTEMGPEGLSFGAYEYSFGYRNAAFATVMAYTNGQPWVGYFSNPLNDACGEPCGQADRSDNVRSINQLAAAVSRFRLPPRSLDVIAGEVFETDAGNARLQVRVRLSTPAPAGGVGFRVRNLGGTATPGLDFVAFDQSLAVLAGQQEVSFAVTVLPDQLDESHETIGLELVDVAGAQAVPALPPITILDDDPRDYLSGRWRYEYGTTPPAGPLTVHVTLQGANGAVERISREIAPDATDFQVPVVIGARVRVDIDAPDPLVAPPVEFGVMEYGGFHEFLVQHARFVSGQVRWPVGQPAPSGAFRLIAWNMLGDANGYYIDVAPPEFRYRIKIVPGSPVRLSAHAPPAPYVPQDLELGAVRQDMERDIELRTLPSLSVSKVDAVEDIGPVEAYFDVRLSVPAPPGGVSFDLATANGTALESDYVPTNWGRITFQQGMQVLRLPLTILGDGYQEKDETVRLVASDPSGAWIPDEGYLRLLNDDGRLTASDFSGDERSDLLWRHWGDGRNTLWSDGQPWYQRWLSRASTAWRIVGIGDFDGDRQDDLFWRNSSTGANVVWPAAYREAQRSEVTVRNRAWQVVGVGNFDEDGTEDLLWRNAATGANVVWRSGRGTSQRALTGVSNLDWRVVATADFDGDSRADILWRNQRTGANTIWRAGASNQIRKVTAVTNLSWDVAGTGDFDGDGLDDILWRHRTAGANVIWPAGHHALRRNLVGVRNLAWQVRAVGDYDGDGRDDVFWRNESTGVNTIWSAADANRVIPTRRVADLAWRVAR